MNNNQKVLVQFLDSEQIRKKLNADFPSREELLKRNSFPGPDENPWIDKFIAADREAKANLKRAMTVPPEFVALYCEGCD